MKHSFTDVKYNGGGGRDDINIAYGNVAPSDTSKLWVMCDEPSKIDMSNNINVALGLDIEEYDTSFNDGKIYSYQIYYDGYLYVFIRPVNNSSIPWVRGGLIKYNIQTKEKQLITGFGFNYTTSVNNEIFSMTIDEIGKKLYISQSTGKLASYNLVDGTIINTQGFTDKVNQIIYNNNKLYSCTYYSTSNYNSVQSIYEYDITTGISTKLLETGTVANIRCSNRVYDNKIYFISNNSITDYGIRQFDICYYDIQLNLFVTTGINVGAFYDYIIYIEGNKIVGFNCSNKEIIIIDLNNGTYEKKTITNNISFVVNYPRGIAVDNSYIYLISSEKTLYRYGYSMELEDGTLSITYDCFPNRWIAMGSDDFILKLNPRKVYLGDSNDKAVGQTALLYNEITQQWEVI